MSASTTCLFGTALDEPNQDPYEVERHKRQASEISLEVDLKSNCSFVSDEDFSQTSPPLPKGACKSLSKKRKVSTELAKPLSPTEFLLSENYGVSETEIDDVLPKEEAVESTSSSFCESFQDDSNTEKLAITNKAQNILTLDHPKDHSLISPISIGKRDNRARLTERERLEIIDELEQACPPTKCSLSRRYGVSEAAVRKIWLRKEKIKARSAGLSKEITSSIKRFDIPKTPELIQIIAYDPPHNKTCKADILKNESGRTASIDNGSGQNNSLYSLPVALNQEVKHARLKEIEKLEIIEILEQACPPTKRSLARKYGVSEAAIGKIWLKRDKIKAKLTDLSSTDTYQDVSQERTISGFDSTALSLDLSSVASCEVNKRTRLTEYERLQIINTLEQPCAPSKRSLSKKYGVSEAAIRKIWLNKEKIKTRSPNLSEKIKDSQELYETTDFPELEIKLYKWIKMLANRNVFVSSDMIVEHAQEIADELQMKNFKPTPYWLHMFKERKGLIGNSLTSLSTNTFMDDQLSPDLHQAESSSSTDHSESIKTPDASFKFDGYKNLHLKVLELNQQLSSSEAQARAPNIYDELKKTFDHFQRLLQIAKLEDQCLQVLQDQYDLEQN